MEELYIIPDVYVNLADNWRNQGFFDWFGYQGFYNYGLGAGPIDLPLIDVAAEAGAVAPNAPEVVAQIFKSVFGPPGTTTTIQTSDGSTITSTVNQDGTITQNVSGNLGRIDPTISGALAVAGVAATLGDYKDAAYLLSGAVAYAFFNNGIIQNQGPGSYSITIGPQDLLNHD